MEATAQEATRVAGQELDGERWVRGRDFADAPADEPLEEHRVGVAGVPHERGEPDRLSAGERRDRRLEGLRQLVGRVEIPAVELGAPQPVVVVLDAVSQHGVAQVTDDRVQDGPEAPDELRRHLGRERVDGVPVGPAVEQLAEAIRPTSALVLISWSGRETRPSRHPGFGRFASSRARAASEVVTKLRVIICLERLRSADSGCDHVQAPCDTTGVVRPSESGGSTKPPARRADADFHPARGSFAGVG